jgi:hypothetical protein
LKLVEQLNRSNLFNFAASTVGTQMCNTVLLGEIEETGDFFIGVSDTLLDLWLVAGKAIQWSGSDTCKNHISVSRNAWYRDKIGISILELFGA